MARTFKGTQYGNLNSLGSIFIFHRVHSFFCWQNPNKKGTKILNFFQALERVQNLKELQRSRSQWGPLPEKKGNGHVTVCGPLLPYRLVHTTGWKKLLTTLEMVNKLREGDKDDISRKLAWDPENPGSVQGQWIGSTNEDWIKYSRVIWKIMKRRRGEKERKAKIREQQGLNSRKKESTDSNQLSQTRSHPTQQLPA
ncbi:hypothetical protein DFH07DRAFT_772916 [Mycena maculata]|uniref:Uncharacterized protein n=1 Tax=Mycena maculata TaxID=230809 RepID=A0AAD7J865_9AGAR|nr:hypothetical protein DFH07DRAFT_772916 [Mycena maculata]